MACARLPIERRNILAKQSKRRKPLNDAGPINYRNPENWGGPDDAARARAEANRPLVEQWRDDGILQDCAEAAIREIEICHRAMTQGLGAKISSYGERVSGGPDRDWPAWVALAIRDRYGPWRDAMAIRRTAFGQPIHEITIDALVDGVSLRSIDSARKWRKGTAKSYIMWGLREYAIMACWAARAK